MADELKNAKDGLKTRLETMTGVRVINQPAETVSQFPVAIVLTEDIDYRQAFSGNTFRGIWRVIVLISKGDWLQGFAELDNYLNPVDPGGGDPRSIKVAIETDRTLGGKVDWALVMRAENIGTRDLWGSIYIGADFLIEYLVTVA